MYDLVRFTRHRRRRRVKATTRLCFQTSAVTAGGIVLRVVPAKYSHENRSRGTDVGRLKICSRPRLATTVLVFPFVRFLLAERTPKRRQRRRRRILSRRVDRL